MNGIANLTNGEMHVDDAEDAAPNQQEQQRQDRDLNANLAPAEMDQPQKNGKAEAHRG